MSSEPSNTSDTSTHFQDLLKDLNFSVKTRWFPLAIDPFSSLENVLYEGMEAEFSELQEDTLDQSEESSNRQVHRDKELCIKQYHELVKLVPTFSDIISGFEKVPSAMDNFIHAVMQSCTLFNPGVDQFNPPLLRQHGKIARGWNHPQTAWLLCPMRMLDKFDSDPSSFMDKVKEGEITITAAKLPAFLYDKSMLDPTRKRQGCLWGYYLKRVFRHIFTGPTSAILANAHKGTKAPKGRMHGMTSPLPRAIAYAAVQLSSATPWCQQIEDFDVVLFYDRVVDMFEGNPNAQWVEETLNHWKSETPGLLHRGRSRSRTDAGLHAFDDSEDDMDNFFDSDERSPNNEEQGSEGGTAGSSGNADNLHGI
ncbi:hypothetical protein EV702DRAFT_1042498 [Suillus placidus]|uniref:Uncharacterized protein n=1 Tax=Suillus placidus TaxID=48579 RepID=A0A9P7A355_9AGAM|nr:hypothetical protein EV702DRAFT_1042498 [Suillus placidus]